MGIEAILAAGTVTVDPILDQSYEDSLHCAERIRADASHPR